jgi:hypothetical protein
MQSVVLTHLSLTSSLRDLRDDVICTIRAVSSLVSRLDWKTLSRFVFRQSKLLDLDECLTPPSSYIGFMTQLTNRSSLDFEGQTKKLLRWFWDTNHLTVTTGFETKIEKHEATGCEAKPRETVNLSFETKPRNLLEEGMIGWLLMSKKKGEKTSW